jgi:thioredoxin reductase (NADPH)
MTVGSRKVIFVSIANAGHRRICVEERQTMATNHMQFGGTHAAIRPVLSEYFISLCMAHGEVQEFAEDTTLYTWGDRRVDFFIVLEGQASVSVPLVPSGEEIVYQHSHGEFVGNTYLLTQRGMLIDVKVCSGSRVLRIPNAGFRKFLTSEPEVAEVVLAAFIHRCMSFVSGSKGGALVVGYTTSNATLRIRRFLEGNRFPHRFLDPELEPEAEGILMALRLSHLPLPVVLALNIALEGPSNEILADRLGVFEPVSVDELYDVAIVGAGPAGLAAAVYAASEGLRTIVLEGHAPGGQAGTSSKIENYLGFPAGVTGTELASRAQNQAQKFGAKLVVSQNVVLLDCEEQPFALYLSGGSCVRSRTVVIATGARYRQLSETNGSYVPDGIHYSATAIEAQVCKDKIAVVVGGGNSAGQAAMFLSKSAKHVHMVIRKPELSTTMSEYLAARIMQSKKITLHRSTEICAIHGNQHVAGVTLKSVDTGQRATLSTANLFVMIGAEPITELLRPSIALDNHGFVLTGPQAREQNVPYATSVPGVFAVGDVCAGSIKRVASAVGEGSVVVAMIHSYLASSDIAPVLH